MPSRSRSRHLPGLEVSATLLEWGAKGDAIAEIEGRRTGIARGIPGEDVVAVIDRRRKPWRGVVASVLNPSSARVTPPCPYYDAGCGGCQWQHLEYEAQLEVKHFIVDREMERAGLAVRVDAVHAMDDPWRYRRTAAIAIGWEAGFRPRGRRGIIEIHDCLISHPLIGELAHELNALLRAPALPNYHGKVWLDCTITGSVAEPRIQVVIQGIEGLALETHPELLEVAEMVSHLPAVFSVAFRHRGGEVIPLCGPLFDTIEVEGRDMFVSAGSFFQTNLTMLAGALATMRGELRERPSARVADIYGGAGTFALSLAPSTEHMTLIELDGQAVEAAARTAKARGLRNVDFLARHAEQALPELSDLDAIIVDPPRSGLGAGVVEAIASVAPPLLLYLSCSPASQTRDLAALLARGYRVKSLDVHDFYPQTHHIETLAVLTL